MFKKSKIKVNVLPVEAIVKISELGSFINLKKFDIKVIKSRVSDVIVPPLNIVVEDIELYNPIGNLRYEMRVSRKNRTREVIATNTFYVRNRKDSLQKISLVVSVSCGSISTDDHDSKLFEMAYIFSKSMLKQIEIPGCGNVDFKLPETYEDVTRESRELFDGYVENRAV